MLPKACPQLRIFNYDILMFSSKRIYDAWPTFLTGGGSPITFSIDICDERVSPPVPSPPFLPSVIFFYEVRVTVGVGVLVSVLWS